MEIFLLLLPERPIEELDICKEELDCSMSSLAEADITSIWEELDWCKGSILALSSTTTMSAKFAKLCCIVSIIVANANADADADAPCGR